MHGDFSLDPRRSGDRVSRVLYQMGRVLLDSDANEQTETQLRALRSLGTDVIGVHAGLGSSFSLAPPDPSKPLEFTIAWGHYYVDGIACVNLPPGMEWWELLANPGTHGLGLPVTAHADSYWDAQAKGTGKQLLYLAVWERHISSAENDSIREVALLGPDTASRAVVVWQIRRIAFSDLDPILRGINKELGYFDAEYVALNLLLRPRGRMRAKAKENHETDACVIAPEAMYRGEENRLYRVEIHEGNGDTDKKKPTFKWAPDNGSIVYPVKRIETTTVYLESLGRDERTAIRKNDWVEVVDDEITLRRIANPLLQVIKVDRQRRTVELSGEPVAKAGSDPKKHPILRRWAGPPREIDEAPRDDPKVDWKELSDGIEVQFLSAELPEGGRVWRTGDYWLIPARAATGNVLWPEEAPEVPAAIRPHGIDEHYAPLASYIAGATTASFTSLRRMFKPLREHPAP